MVKNQPINSNTLASQSYVMDVCLTSNAWELLGLGLDLAFGSVTSESESVLHSMSLSVSDFL